jgi:small subunit ribosomal protein S16
LVKIRLKRMGAKRKPFYRVVVADSRTPRDGRFLEQLGYYDPLTEPATIKIDEEKVVQWLNKGAQPSDSARMLLRRVGVLERYAETRKAGTGAGAASDA